MTMRRAAIALLTAAILSNAATASGATRVTATGARVEVTVDEGSAFHGSTDTSGPEWTIGTLGPPPPVLAPGGPCREFSGKVECPGDRFGSLLVRGGSLADRIFARGSHTIVLAGGGNDQLFGEGGAQSIFGETGDDDVSLGGGTPTLGPETGGSLDGGPGNDTLRDESRHDRTLISGGPGNDLVVDRRARDVIDGGGGDDLLVAVDGRGDRVRCGDGNDTAELDASDVPDGCETVRHTNAGARATRIRVSASGRITLRVACPAVAGDACRGRVWISDSRVRTVDSFAILVGSGEAHSHDADLSRSLRRRLRRGRGVGIRVTTTTYEGSPQFANQRTIQRFVLRRNRTFTSP